MTRRIRAALLAVVTAAGLLSAVTALPSAAGAATDSFYTYSGTQPLSSYRPGAVLRTRTVTYKILGVPLPVDVTQVLYRSTNARGEAIAAVTSVLRAPGATTPATNVVAYQSFYDSLNPEDGPSRAFADGGSDPFGTLANFANLETLLIAPLLLAGDALVVTDTEGPTADFAAGPEYGMVTLDALRAVSAIPSVSPTARIGMLGYSGGAIATNWAATLAPSYAPEIDKRLVGAAEGGILVDPDHNLHYIEGSLLWSGVMPMAIIGVARAYGVDLKQYLSPYGATVYDSLEHKSIVSALGAYPGLTWKKLAKPQYPTPESVPAFVDTVNKLNLGSQPAPTVPLFMGQGANGLLEGTPGFGKGDGVMVAGDVRALARQYCAAGTKVTYRQYDLTSHVTTVPLWLPEAYSWLTARLQGQAAPQNCSTIAAGNSLAPVTVDQG